MMPTFAWLPLSPLRPWAMSASRKTACGAAFPWPTWDLNRSMSSPANEVHLRFDAVFADERGPVSKHLAHCRPPRRVTSDAGRSGTHERRELLGKSLHDRAPAVPNADPQGHLQRLLGLRHYSWHTGARSEQFNVLLLGLDADPLQPSQDHLAARLRFCRRVRTEYNQRATCRVSIPV